MWQEHLALIRYMGFLNGFSFLLLWWNTRENHPKSRRDSEFLSSWLLAHSGLWQSITLSQAMWSVSNLPFSWLLRNKYKEGVLTSQCLLQRCTPQLPKFLQLGSTPYKFYHMPATWSVLQKQAVSTWWACRELHDPPIREECSPWGLFPLRIPWPTLTSRKVSLYMLNEWFSKAFLG